MSNEKRNEGSSCSPSATNGDPNPCPICLSSIPYLQESYLDHCFHKFCYKCIVQWSKVISRKLSTHQPLSAALYVSVFISEAHRYRLRCYSTEPGDLGNMFNIQRCWKFQKFLQPNQWLQPWLRREIQALIQEEDVEITMHHILGTMDSFRRRFGMYPDSTQKEFKEVVSSAARPFLSGRTDRFVEEIKGFLASGLSLKAYDKVYMQQIEQIWNAAKGKRIDPPEEHIGDGTTILDPFILDEDDD